VDAVRFDDVGDVPKLRVDRRGIRDEADRPAAEQVAFDEDV
jgi:hypothetical protein